MASPEIRFGFSLPSDVSNIARHAQELEELGYDFLGLGEHLMLGNPPAATILSIPALGVAAGATRRIRLLSGVIILPLYDPVVLAKLVTTLDTASGGRYIFGIGIGGESPDDYRAGGVPLKQRGRRADEALSLLKRLWTEENVSFEGRFYKAEDVTLRPGPSQQPHPPIWVAGRREPAMRRAARFGDGWFPYMYNPQRYRDSVAKIREYAVQEGRDLTDFSWGFHQHIVLGDSAEEALRAGAETFHYLSGRDPADVVRDYWIYGTPADIIKGLEQLVDSGAREISLIGAYSDESTTMELARTLARKVIPHFRA